MTFSLDEFSSLSMLRVYKKETKVTKAEVNWRETNGARVRQLRTSAVSIFPMKTNLTEAHVPTLSIQFEAKLHR